MHIRVATFEQVPCQQDFLSLVRLLVRTNVSQRTFSYGMGLQGILVPEFIEVSGHCPLFSFPLLFLAIHPYSSSFPLFFHSNCASGAHALLCRRH